MRLNVYTEELITPEDNKPMCEIVTAEYISSRTGEKMTNYGLRIFFRSAPELHYIPGRDDDRSAVTFWCGKRSNIAKFVDFLHSFERIDSANNFRDIVDKANVAATSEPLYERGTTYYCGNGHKLDYPNQLCNLCLAVMDPTMTIEKMDPVVLIATKPGSK